MWYGYTYKIPDTYTGSTDTQRNFPIRDFKGFLPYDQPGFLRRDTINFDINFNDTGNTSTDGNYFSTIYHPNDATAGCDVQLNNFGVILLTQFRIPETGIYKITIGSDDGSYLKESIGGNVKVIHDNWGPGKTYNYEENIFDYYREYEANTWVHYDLSYYEKTGSNRLSFKIVKYVGPGEIEGRQDVCGIAPNPREFGSKGPATYEEGDDEGITYQWQYSLDDDPDGTWTDIVGANGLTYKIPKYDVNDPEYDENDPERNWVGRRYFRRVAIPTAIVSATTASNIVEVNISPIADWDREEYGDNEWIGHVYRGEGEFSEANYAGRTENASANFRETFGNENMNDHRFDLDYGCYIVTTDFSVKYKMKLDVVPDTYTFTVFGDDGFRLYANGQKILDKWEGSQGERSTDYVVTSAGQLELELQYYEGTGRSEIEFSYTSLILPLEWGRVSAEACGPANCLTWETIQEKNTSHFELERSYNGMDWEMFDNSVLAQGNSTEKISYDFTDNQFMASKVYYRIRQVDLDGAYEYSEVMRVDNPFYATGFLPFPNPTMDKIRFFSKSEVVGLWLVSNDYLVNKEVKPEMMNDNRYEVDLVGLKPGNYVIVVETRDGEKDVFKVIKK